MFKPERQSHILQLLEEKRFCTVKFLADHLYVAPITVRRDLQEMENAGLLKRSHGGAAIQDHKNREVPFEIRDRENTEAKSKIAKMAAGLLQDGNTVFMDASSTVGHLADYLKPDQNLTIITNSIRVLDKLKGKKIRCYLTGGMLLENSHALVGTLAEAAISSLYADICFFSSQGISEDGVITDFSEDETRLRKCMIKHAKKSVFLFDSSKLGKQFMFQVCHADELFQIISDT